MMAARPQARLPSDCRMATFGKADVTPQAPRSSHSSTGTARHNDLLADRGCPGRGAGLAVETAATFDGPWSVQRRGRVAGPDRLASSTRKRPLVVEAKTAASAAAKSGGSFEHLISPHEQRCRTPHANVACDLQI